MNIVALATEMMEERDPITCYADLHQLVVDLLSKLNTWSKYEKGSLRDCPNLAQPTEVILEEVAEVANIFDIDACTTLESRSLEVHDEEDSCEEEVPAGDEEVLAEGTDISEQNTMEGENDMYRDYMMG